MLGDSTNHLHGQPQRPFLVAAPKTTERERLRLPRTAHREAQRVEVGLLPRPPAE